MAKIPLKIIFGFLLGLILNPICIGGNINEIFTPEPALAVQLRDGTVAFAKSPVLLNFVTTYNTILSWSAKYYVTILIPPEAGEPLSEVVIEEREGSERIVFIEKKTLAFQGTIKKRGEPLPVTVSIDEENRRRIRVKFEPPVQPGATITIGLKPRQNPWFSGIYLFGVTAYPQGEKSQGMYLGVGRLHFYSPFW